MIFYRDDEFKASCSYNAPIQVYVLGSDEPLDPHTDHVAWRELVLSVTNSLSLNPDELPSVYYYDSLAHHALAIELLELWARLNSCSIDYSSFDVSRHQNASMSLDFA